jgi:hypothetical protein
MGTRCVQFIYVLVVGCVATYFSNSININHKVFQVSNICLFRLTIFMFQLKFELLSMFRLTCLLTMFQLCSWAKVLGFTLRFQGLVLMC